MRVTVRVTIEIEFAEEILGIFRNALESGMEFNPDTIAEYEKFTKSVRKAKKGRTLGQV